VQATDQPYVFTNDDPLNSVDPLGLYLSSGTGQSAFIIQKTSDGKTKTTTIVASGSKSVKIATVTSSSARSSTTSGGSSSNPIGDALSWLGNGFANIGLGLDITSEGEATSIVGVELAPETFGLGLIANTGATASDCLAGAFNDNSYSAAAVGCAGDVGTQYLSESHVSSPLVHETLKLYGDVRTSINDLRTLAYGGGG